MAVQSRYEGADLETVLEQVREELGSGTKIVSANKIRSGGVGGFFARERFEVIVEHDEALLLSRPVAAVADDPQQSVRPRDLAPSLMDLVDQVSAEERAAAPRISTESAPFAAVLERVARDAGVAPAHAAAAEPEDVEEDEDDDEAIEAVAAPAPAPAPVAAPAPAPTPAPVPAVVEARPDPFAARPMPATVISSAPSTGGGHVGALVKLGLPATYVPAVPSPAAVEAALRSSLTRLPSAPPMPRTTGAVVVVVGERQAAMKVARDLAGEAGLDPDTITLATSKRAPARSPQHLLINGSDDAAEKRRSWRRRDRPSLVVLDAELGAEKPAWAYHVLAALEPEATWGVVDATRKTEDVAAWMQGLGGVDALAVNDVDATVSPAAVLQLDVPVGRIDGRTASPALWAALLTERLAA